MQVVTSPPAIPVGKIKRFGPFDPKYEVGHALRRLDGGDWMIEVMSMPSLLTWQYQPRKDARGIGEPNAGAGHELRSDP